MGLSKVKFTHHADDRLAERKPLFDGKLRQTAIIAANLAKPYLELEEPKEFWHEGCSIVAVKAKNGSPRLVTVIVKAIPEVISQGLKLVSGILTPRPLKFRFGGYSIIAKQMYGQPQVVLAWKGGVYETAS